MGRVAVGCASPGMCLAENRATCTVAKVDAQAWNACTGQATPQRDTGRLRIDAGLPMKIMGGSTTATPCGLAVAFAYSWRLPQSHHHS